MCINVRNFYVTTNFALKGLDAWFVKQVFFSIRLVVCLFEKQTIPPDKRVDNIMIYQ